MTVRVEVLVPNLCRSFDFSVLLVNALCLMPMFAHAQKRHHGSGQAGLLNSSDGREYFQ